MPYAQHLGLPQQQWGELRPGARAAQRALVAQNQQKTNVVWRSSSTESPVRKRTYYAMIVTPGL
jgi:hypothetical protein